MTWEEWFDLTYEQLAAKYEEWKQERHHIVERLVKAISPTDELLDFLILAQLRCEVLGRMQLACLAAIAGAPPDGLPPVVPVGRPISKLDRLVTTQTTYQTVVEWEIPALHKGELFDIEMASSDYAKTQFRLVLANEEQWTDKYLLTHFSQSFRGNRLTETMKCIIQAKSTDGTQVTVYGAISGNLYAP